MQNPKMFVTRQRRARLWLRELRKVQSTAPQLRPQPGGGASAKARPVRLFVLSNADFEHVNGFMSYSYGGDWLTLFDLVVVNAKKRTFYEDSPTTTTVDGAGRPVSVDMETKSQRLFSPVRARGSCREQRVLVAV